MFTALQAIRARLPFPLLGIDSDNGRACINELLLRYCQQEPIPLTRCRASHKNDQAHSEQKNDPAVRQVGGSDRLSGSAAVELWDAVYALYRVLHNRYVPVMPRMGKPAGRRQSHQAV